LQNDFTALVIAYSLVFAGIACYTLYLGWRTRKLRQEIERLKPPPKER